MLELPEGITVAGQLNQVAQGKKITRAEAAYTPHGFAFYYEKPSDYPARLEGRTLGSARGLGPYIEIQAEDTTLLLGDGANLRLLAPGEPPPAKHQLYLLLDDGSALVGTVQMYAALMAFPNGAFDNVYYTTAREKVNALSEGFTPAYFDSLAAGVKPSLSAKAFLATEQRIPGLGNGCLQDILFNARIHPKKKLSTFTDGQLESLYESTRNTMVKMTEQGGRNTEKDLFGQPGGYKTILSAKTWKEPCPVCGGPITKQAYLGGAVYFCPVCQPV